MHAEKTLTDVRNRLRDFGGGYLAAAAAADLHPMQYVFAARSADGKHFSVEPLDVVLADQPRYPSAELVAAIAACQRTHAPAMALAIFGFGATAEIDKSGQRGDLEQSGYRIVADAMGNTETTIRRWTPDGPAGDWSTDDRKNSVADWLASALRVCWLRNDSIAQPVGTGPKFGSTVED